MLWDTLTDNDNSINPANSSLSKHLENTKQHHKKLYPFVLPSGPLGISVNSQFRQKIGTEFLKEKLAGVEDQDFQNRANHFK